MNAKKVGRALLFGAAVGTATYAVQKLWPVIEDWLGLLKAAWDDATDLNAMYLDDDDDAPITLSRSTKPESEPKAGATVAEVLGDFLGIGPEKARKLLDSMADEEEADDTCEGCKYLDSEDGHCQYCDDCEIRGKCGAGGFCDNGCRNLDALPVIGAEAEDLKRDTRLPYNAMSTEALKNLAQNIA